MNAKKLFFGFTLLITLQINAQNFLISFAGTGASTSVSIVKVENFSTGETVIIHKGEILRLIGTAGITSLEKKSYSLKIYPNPTTKENTVIQISPPDPGNAVITIFDLTGKIVLQSKSYLQEYPQEFRLSGINNGFYVINVTGNTYHFSGKLLANSNSNGTIQLEKISTDNPSDEITKPIDSKRDQTIVNMAYSYGDRLRFTGMAENYSTVKMDIPESDKVISFNFIPCTDEDNNNYPIVEIGSQIWMAENLKTTKYNNGSNIEYHGNNINNWNNTTVGAYVWYENNKTDYKNTYGALYNWYAVKTGKLCPAGWHVPKADEWLILTENLGGKSVAGSKIKETGYTHWSPPNKLSTNESGFSALPGGMLTTYGFTGIKLSGYLWSSSFDSKWNGTPAWNVNLSSEDLSESEFHFKNQGNSVRCVLGKVFITIPVILTDTIKKISTDAAIGGGIINSDGGDPITAHGLCWSISENPTTEDYYTLEAFGTNSFTSKITGLKPGTTYFVRAYATNTEGTAYGDDLTFTTRADIPTLTTKPVFGVTQTKATSGGNITSKGGAELTTSGICWSSYGNPTITGSHTADSSSNDNFESIISGLLPNTIYYIRAYATNSVGIGYGNEISFTTSPIRIPALTTTAVSSVTSTTALSGGNIAYDGGGSITSRGICWAASSSPTIGNNKTVNGTGTGNFTSSLSGLQPGTTYYVRAYATNIAGTAYGDELSFTAAAIIPSLSTTHISGITQTNATSGGNITSNGGAQVTASGLCWSTSPNPSTEGFHTTDGPTSGSFESSITGLLPNTLYYVRAYATNTAGTGYGNEISFTTDPIRIPVLATNAVTSVTSNTASSGGNITDDGGGTITARGICWSTTIAPTVGNNKTTNGTGTGSFTSDITGLQPGTTYHLRAYSTNSAGTAYGDELIFTTDAVIPTLITTVAYNITRITAASGGTNTTDGGAAVITSGICWSTSPNPSISGSHTTDGTKTGSFISNMTGLVPNTFYYIRAYATNSVGTGYGNEVSFTTDQIEVATLTTNSVTSITSTSASSGGNITDDGGGTVTARGICWSINSAPTIADNRTSNGTGSGSFNSNITGLQPGITYHVRAYATNSAGTAYGNDLIFTAAAVIPSLTTTAAYGITRTTATLGGNNLSDGGAPVITSGICWSTSHNPSISGSHTIDGTSNGNFTSGISGLVPGTLYYVRAYATNSAGTGYGNEVSFTTDPIVIASLTTTSVTSVTSTTATSGGNITDDGGGAITSRGICWATTSLPDLNDSRTSNGTGAGNFTGNITGLLPVTTYHIRAYAINSAGTAFGNDISFTTTAALPVLTTNPASGITQTGATSGGNITSNGGAQVVTSGICWSTSHNPSISGSHTSDGSLTGGFVSSIAGLSPNTLYYVRAYATNSAGTGYGNEISFTTNPILIPTVSTVVISSVTTTTASSGGNISDDGGGPVTVRGVCWATTSSPTTANNKTTNGTGTGSYTSSITGLQPGTTYHVRAYATNSAGTAYGNDLTFTTVAVIPSLTTTTVTLITRTAATSGGNITSNGGAIVITSGICWSTSHNPSLAGSSTSDGAAIGSFTSGMTGLLPGTLYYVRAYATNSVGTAYGIEVSFTTSPVTIPTVTTTTVTSIASSTATSGGNISDDGGDNVTSRGICWSLTPTPTISNDKTTDGSGTGSYTSNITGLQSETTYYVRAYATNSIGTAYGAQLSFTTDLPPNTDVTFSTSADGSLLLHSIGDKRLNFTTIGSDNYLKFSIDNGVTYIRSIKVTGIFTSSNKARILENGNIVLFCGSKIYYSDNELATITSCNVLNKDGSIYTLHNPVNPVYPGAYFHFMGGFAENGGVSVMGNYTSTSSGPSPVNLYYSLDGITWKVFYTFGQNPNHTDNGTAMGGVGGTLLGDPNNPLIAQHIHAVNIGGDGNFYACTGDDDGEMHFLKCSYDRITDNWTTSDLLSGASRTWQRMRALGVFERNGYLYWGSDGPGTFTYNSVQYNSFGIYKCAVSDINDPSKHILLKSLTDACYSFVNADHIVFTGMQTINRVYISYDYGETWITYAKPAWMTGDVRGVWYNQLHKYLGTSQGVMIESTLF